MKKYLVVTNIWGKKEITMWFSRDVFEEEKEYFDTLDEAKDFALLFKEYASVYPNPEKKTWDNYFGKENKYYSVKTKLAYNTFKPGEMLWGYVICDTEECKVLEWGGLCMYHIHKKMDQRQVKDYLFRGEDEIPKDYVWDDDEYEGWLQYRWGDGKNALDYVEPEKPKKPEKVCNISEGYTPEEFTEVLNDMSKEYEEIENSFLKDEDKEKLKRLIDRW